MKIRLDLQITVFSSFTRQKFNDVYCNGICLLDATYKTTKYAIPLFFLAVKTNVDYQVVASFAQQDETTSAIGEAIKIIKQWNPLSQPRIFMVDNCDEEIRAINMNFERKLNKRYLQIA